MAETNQLLINYYKKEEMKKVKKMMEEKLEVGEIIKSVNMEWISKEEVLSILGEDYEPVIKESKVEDKHKNENMINTPSVIQNTPMEIAKKYKKYFEEYNQKKKQIRIAEIIQNYNYEITDNIAQKIKRDFGKSKKIGENYILSKEKLESYKNEKSFKLTFTQEEIQKYFNGIPNKKIKEYIISILENTQDV